MESNCSIDRSAYLSLIDQMLKSPSSKYLKRRFDYDDFVVVFIHLVVLLILLSIILTFQFIWILVSLAYPTIKCYRSQQQQYWLCYFLIIAFIFNLDPVLKFVIHQILPIYGIARTLFIFWLQKNDAEGTKTIVELVRSASNIDPKQLKLQIEEIIDKVSARNF